MVSNRLARKKLKIFKIRKYFEDFTLNFTIFPENRTSKRVLGYFTFYEIQGARKLLWGWNFIHKKYTRGQKTSQSHFFDFSIFFKMAAIFIQNQAFSLDFLEEMAAILKKIKKSKKCFLEVFCPMVYYLCTKFQPSSTLPPQDIRQNVKCPKTRFEVRFSGKMVKI